MSGQWKKCLLGDLVELKRGYDLPTSSRIPGDYPIVSSSGISGTHVEAKVKAPGVVTGRYGTLGQVFYLKEDFWPLNTSLYVRDFKRNHPRFIAYFLGSLGLASSNAAGAVPGLNRNHLHQLEVSAPDYETQERVASILVAYDDLIENNMRRIEILEEMARRLYEEWFVHFRFPGHDEVSFKESELGEIPQGWEVRRLEDTVALNPRTKVPKVGEKWFVPMRALSESSMIVGNLERKPGNSGAKFQNADTLVARITPCLENGKTGFVDFLPEDQPTACGSTEFIVLRSISLCPEMVYLLARSDRFRDVAIKSMSGATGRQRVRVESLVDFPVVQPDSATLETFQRFVSPFFKQARTLALKNSNLHAQRDLLLPKLVSGEIDVSDIPMPDDKEVEAA
ncbi:restriction endonuclease subunit S [Alloalcanivorax gelatiniphagus]|nr:restriction endonuclease subunit S [Alloalcanivorax gelatiniphagus]